MGVGRSWSTPPSTASVAIPADSHRLFHQMGRGGATLRSHWTTYCQISLAKHLVSLRTPPTPLSLTMGQTLPASKWPTSALSIRLPIDSPCHIILKIMVRLSSTIVPSSTACVKAWTEQRANEPRNSLECSGLTRPPSASQRVKSRSHCHMERK